MQSVMVDFISSLDGYAAAEGWPGYWGIMSPEYLAWLEAQTDDEYTILMGATTYRLMSGFAEEMGDDPGFRHLEATPKVVFSSTLEAPLRWANSELVADDAVEWVRAAKDGGVREMRTLGSLSICRALLTAGLVDRFRVVVFPVVTGATGQDPIYQGWPDVKLELLESKSFELGLQLLDYVPKVLGEPSSIG